MSAKHLFCTYCRENTHKTRNCFKFKTTTCNNIKCKCKLAHGNEVIRIPKKADRCFIINDKYISIFDGRYVKEIKRILSTVICSDVIGIVNSYTKIVIDTDKFCISLGCGGFHKYEDCDERACFKCRRIIHNIYEKIECFHFK